QEWDNAGGGQWLDARVHGAEATLSAGRYRVQRRDGSVSEFAVSWSKFAAAPVTGRISRAERYGLAPLLFAPAHDKADLRVDAAVTRFFGELARRGPLVSVDDGGGGPVVSALSVNIARLEKGRLDGELVRAVTEKEDGALVARYTPANSQPAAAE